jgi:LacI family transcriptional regulator
MASVMRGKPVTLSDVAQKADVSITTVSHVINKTRYVSPDTRENVLRILDELNYHVANPRARTDHALKVIGVVIADIREDFYMLLMKAMETVASEYGITILFCDSEDDLEKERSNIRYLLSLPIGGLIVAPAQFAPFPRELKNAEIPIILVDRQYRNHDTVFVGINNFQSGRAATDFLFQKGCRNIGFIGSNNLVYSNRERALGYKTSVLENLPAGSPKIQEIKYEREDSYKLIKGFIVDNNFDGLVCSNSNICNEAIEVIDDLHLAVPEEMKIITHDDNRWFGYLKYPISIVTQPTGEIGNCVVERMIELAEQTGERKRIKTEVLFDTHIIDNFSKSNLSGEAKSATEVPSLLSQVSE